VVSYVQPSTYSLKNRHCIGDGGKCCEKRILLLLLLIGCVGNGQLHMIAGLKNEVFGILSIMLNFNEDLYLGQVVPMGF
jgi:hypothetical protein